MKKSKPPWMPLAPPSNVTLAIKGLATGTANDEQQKIALKWIIETLCCTYDWPYRPESERDTNVLLGRQFVGKQIVKEININSSLLRREDRDNA